jgi:glycerophosphoryl diester phosphodiesterase
MRHDAPDPNSPLHETLIQDTALLFAGTILLLLLVLAGSAFASPARHVDLYCHRTANADVPENTLASLEQAALLGCDAVEVDVRRTLDGILVLNHDGFLERLTDGTGEIERSYFAELQLRDFGGWMSPRFAGLPIARFDDALRLAREHHLVLMLDIKTPGLVLEILAEVRRGRMLNHIRWPPDSAEVKRLIPGANVGSGEAWVQPGVTEQKVAALHTAGKRVIAGFSANGHELDLAAMQSAVRAGVDGIDVDYPRLGSDAVGRPVERRLAAFIAESTSGAGADRARSILSLSKYSGFNLTSHFAQWLCDSDSHVSRAAAVALVTMRPAPQPTAFISALASPNGPARANAAWALGQLRAPASMLVPLLRDQDPEVLAESLLALSRMPGDVSAEPLVDALTHAGISVRGPAALALAAHHPDIASRAIASQLATEIRLARNHYDRWAAAGKPKLAQAEIDVIVGYYRCDMKMVQALALLHDSTATEALETEAFRPSLDFSQMNGVVAAFQLWDRIAADPNPALAALSSAEPVTANHAEWMLLHAGAAVFPAIQAALLDASPSTRERLVRILALSTDPAALPILQSLEPRDAADRDLIAWAMQKIDAISPPQTHERPERAVARPAV